MLNPLVSIPSDSKLIEAHMSQETPNSDDRAKDAVDRTHFDKVNVCRSLEVTSNLVQN